MSVTEYRDGLPDADGLFYAGELPYADGLPGRVGHPHMIYLNNAATSYPKPPEVAVAMEQALLHLPGAANRGGIEDFDVMDEARRALGRVMGVGDHRQIALGPNATWGLNLAIFGVGLDAGDWVVTTKAEHNSVLRPLHALSQDKRVRVCYVGTDDAGRVREDEWRAAIQKHRPRLAVFTHASNVTGAVNDAEALTKAAKEGGALVLLDLAQSLGWLDIALDAWGVDLAAFTGHKYLLGPQGTGGLYVREGLNLIPHLVGGTGIRSNLDTMPKDMPLHVEAGTGNEPGAYGLLAALAWAEEHPVSSVHKAVGQKLDYLEDALEGLGARVIRPKGPRMPVISFTLGTIPPGDVGDALLNSYDIIVRTGLHCAPRVFEGLGVDSRLGTVRISLSRFTTHDELMTLARALDDIASSESDWL
jgi:selenocysteine lyase/cysteine desulfurase